MAKYEWIICSGDSFTFGDELGGDVLFPGYTGFRFDNYKPKMSKHQTNLANTLYKNKKDASPKILKRYENACKLNAYPKMLEYFYPDRNIKNIAYSGISNKEIIHRAQETMFSLSKTKSVPFEKMLFYIMLTTPVRVGMPEHFYDSQFGYQSASPSSPTKEPKERWITFNHMFETYNDWDYLWESASDIIAFKQLAENLGAKVIFLDSCMFRMFMDNFDNYPRLDKHLYINRLLDIKFNMADTAKRLGNKEQLAGGHYTKKVHDHFAQTIALHIAELEKDV